MANIVPINLNSPHLWTTLLSMVLKCDMEVHASPPLGSDTVLGSVVLEDSKSGVRKCETILQIWDETHLTHFNFGILKTETYNGKD